MTCDGDVEDGEHELQELDLDGSAAAREPVCSPGGRSGIPVAALIGL
jgi:hypothetical protein